MRLTEFLAQLEFGNGRVHGGGFGHELHPHRQQAHGPQAAFKDRAWGVVAAHAIDRHPEAIGIVDGLAIDAADPLLETAQRIHHQRLQHRIGRGTRCSSGGSSRADDGTSH